jgi:uncharacterized HAD superfamily protein
LNNFTETLEQTVFPYDDSHGLTKEKFDFYIRQLQNDVRDKSELLSNDYSYFRYKIHKQCYQLAKAKTDGVEFMHWLKDNNWKIVICTYRDLRRANDCTKKWLHDNNVPYDHLFTVKNKIVFCKMWKIPYLIDDDVFNILHGQQYGIQVYYSIMKKHEDIQKTTARGFHVFDEVKQWIQE